MIYTFRPPVVWEAPIGIGPLFSRYRQPRGISVLVIGTSVVENRFPTQDAIDAADTVYIGGHEYWVEGEAADILIDAGYGDLLESMAAYSDIYSDIY